MKFNLAKILRAAPGVISLGKSTIDAIKGSKTTQDKIDVSADALLQILPVMEAALDVDVADMPQWSAAVASLVTAEREAAEAAVALSDARRSVLQLVANIQEKRR